MNHAQTFPASRRRVAIVAIQGKYSRTKSRKENAVRGVKPAVDGVNFTGPNVLGRLLMELRDRGQLEYRLPDDALGYIKILQNVRKGAGI